MKKDYKPGELFNAYKMKKAKKHGLRSPEVVVADEQRSSHQYYKKNKRKMTNIGITKRGGKKTNIGIMRQTGKQTAARKPKKKINFGKIKNTAKMIGRMPKAFGRALTGKDLKERFPKKK